MKKRLSVLLAIVMLFSLTACGETPTTTTTGSSDTTGDASSALAEHVTVAIDVLPGSYDPSNNAFPIFNRLAYDELINYNKETCELEPALATKWEWKDTACTTLHLELRKDVKFHNGNSFNAADVEFTMAHNSNANIAGYYDHCVINSDYDIDIVLSSGNADFAYMLTNTLYAGVIDKESCEADPDFGTAIGTGPWAFDLKNCLDGDRYEFVRNDNYWGKVPETKQLTVRYIKESSARLIAMQNNEISAFCTVGETDVETIKNDSSLTYLNGAGIGPAKMYYICFNMKNGKAANNLPLRQAIACAMNNAEIIAAYGDPGAVESDGAFWGSSTPYRATKDDFKVDLSYNVERAKELVKEAEKINGGPIPTLKLLSNYSKSVNSTMCLAVQAECKAIGLNVEIIESDSAGVISMSKYAEPGDYDMLQYNVPLEAWPSAVSRMLVQDSNNNRAILDDNEITDLLKQGAATNDEDARKAAYVAVQVKVHDEAIYIPVYYGSRDGAKRVGVEGVLITNDGYPEFTYVTAPSK